MYHALFQRLLIHIVYAACGVDVPNHCAQPRTPNARNSTLQLAPHCMPMRVTSLHASTPVKHALHSSLLRAYMLR